MPTVAPRRPTPGVKPDSLVEQSIAAAAGKVRLNDLFTGGATAAVLALTYVVVMVILDKWLVLPAWVRQLGFAGFLATLGSVLYFAVVRPWRRRVNPRYIARQVEQTIPDAKNVLINWVDLQDEALPGSVKSAVAAKAADGLAGADVDSATQSKRLMWLCISAGLLVAVLAVLFILFKWSQFSSLVGRAVNPFSGAAIASRTRIDLLDPTGGHATVTEGEQLNVAVSIGGSVPDPNGPDKPRLLVRHNPEATTYDEFPLVRGDSSREFALMVPRSVIQNGFWYKVAAGDAVTDEYRVDVRTRPLITGFHAEYEYPKYLKWNNATGTDARLKAIRGTAVTVTVQTNREAASGSLIVTAGKQTDAIRGEVTGANRDALRFKLKLVESGTYTVQFKPAGADTAITSAEYPIDVEIDQPPTIALTAPKDDEAVLPASALLAVDASLEDDHGLVTAALRFKLGGRDAVVIPAKKYRDGKPFVREKDGTFESAVKDYKDSVKLDTLTDATGKPVTLKEGDVLEYWVEATDNCTEPLANVGESAHKKVRIAPPPPKPDPKQRQKDQQRKADEQKAQQQQDQRRQNDTRPQDQARDPDPNKQPQDPMKGEQGGDPQQQNQANPNQKPDPNQKPMGGGNDPNQKPDPNQQPDPNQKPDPNQQGNPNEKNGDGAKQSDQEIQKQADDLNKKIEQKNSEPGDGKGDGNSAPKGTETKPNQEKKPADSKGGDGEQNAAQEKGGDTGEKAGEQKSADSKDSGKLTPPERSADKEGPKDDAQPNQQPTGDQKSAPKDGADKAGTSKESKPEQGTQPNDPMNQGGEKSGEAGTAKGTQPQAGQKGGQGGNDQKADQKEIEKAIGELDHENPGTREAARQKLDKEIGKQNRETVERLNRDLKSGDPRKQEQAKKEIDELTKKAKQQEQQSGGQSGQPDKSNAKNPDELSKAKDKGEPDRGGTKKEEKQPAGRDGADSKEPRPDDNNGAGEAKGEKPGEPGAKKDAQPKAGGAGNDQKGPPPDAGEQKGPPKAGPNDPMNPMKGGDESSEGKGEGAKQEKPMGAGSDGDEKATTKPPMTRDDAKGGMPDAKQGEGNKEQKQPGGAGGSDEKLDPKEIEKAVRELDSENPGTREAARQKLDKAIGKENRETVERLNRDLKSDDKQKQEQAKKDIEELAKKSGQPQQPQQPKELTEQEKKEIADAAKNLNSKNEAERKAAEQKIDQMVGKDKREEFQKDLKDIQGDDPQKAQQAREKLEKMAKDAMNQKPAGNTDELAKNLGGGNYDQKGQPIEDNPEFRLKTMERQLDQFKNYRGKKEFLKENNLTEEQYDKFLRGYEEMVNRTRDDLDQQRLNPTVKPQLGTPTVRNDAGGQRVVGREGDAVKGTGGVSVAPAGFSEAQKRFAQEAAKRAAEKQK